MSEVSLSTILPLTVASLAGGAIGTVVTTYVGAGREGRAARARVRECLAETEDLRWLDADFQDFRKALSRLEAAAIIARFDRSLILRYTYLANVAHYQEISERAALPDLPARSLPLGLAALLESVLAVIANEAWRPRFWRFRRKRYIWVLDKMTARRQAEHPDWAWNVTPFKPRLMTREPGIKAAVKRRTGGQQQLPAAKPEPR
jgi:hypothetical protein